MVRGDVRREDRRGDDGAGRAADLRRARRREYPHPGPIEEYDDFSSHNEWGTDHFGFLYQGDLAAFCEALKRKGVTFPVPLKQGVGGSLLCYVAAPDGVSIELMQC